MLRTIALPIVVDFREASGAEVAEWIRSRYGIDVLIHPRCRGSDRPCTLQSERETLHMLFTRLADRTGNRVAVRNVAIGLLPRDDREPSAPTARF